MMQYFPTLRPRWGLMWLSAMTIYLACKLITLRNTKKIETTRWRRQHTCWRGLEWMRFASYTDLEPIR